MTHTIDSSPAPVAFDQARADAFVGKVLGDTVGLATTAMASLGDRLGLFKDLASNGASTSDVLAARTGTQERYVREWLGAMANAGYLDTIHAAPGIRFRWSTPRSSPTKLVPCFSAASTMSSWTPCVVRKPAGSRPEWWRTRPRRISVLDVRRHRPLYGRLV